MLRQDVPPVLGDDHEVLDAHATDAGQVDARLDGHDMARDEPRPAGPCKPRRLVDVEPDAVPEAMAEVVAVARGGDDVAGDRVDLATGRARLDGVQRGDLRAQDERVGLLELVGHASPVAQVRVQSEQ